MKEKNIVYKKNFNVVLEELKQFEHLSPMLTPLVVDIETSGLSPRVNVIACIAVRDLGSEKNYLFAVNHTDTEPQVTERQIRELGKVVGDRGDIYFNNKFDHSFLLKYGWGRPLHDAQFLAVLDDYSKGLSLEDQCSARGFSPKQGSPVNYKKGETFCGISAEAAYDYAVNDVLITGELYLSLYDKMKSDPSYGNLYDLEMLVSEYTLAMETNGILLDREKFQSLLDLWEEQAKKIESEFRIDLAKELGIPYVVGETPIVEFSINSTSRLSDMLFNQLGVPTKGIKRTQTGYSTAKKGLERLASKYPLVKKVVDFRKATKAASTTAYIKSIEDDGRIRTDLKQVHVISGRFASSSPNVQNVSKVSVWGIPSFRTAFIASPNHYFLFLDYSQIELRVFAYLAKADKLLEAFFKGEDIHRRTAAMVFGKKIEAVTDSERSRAKTVNFGLLYGQGTSALAISLDISYVEAEGLQTKYFEAIPEFSSYVNDVKAKAQKQGGIFTAFGRWVPLPNLFSRDRYRAAKAGRLAVNSSIQGTAADIMKYAILKVGRYLDKHYPTVRMLLTVHDEIILEVPDEIDINVLAPLLKGVMEMYLGNSPEGVNLGVSASFGLDWGNEEDLEVKPSYASPTPITVEVTDEVYSQLSSFLEDTEGDFIYPVLKGGKSTGKFISKVNVLNLQVLGVKIEIKK